MSKILNIFLKKKQIIDIVSKENNAIELSLLVARLTDLMTERVAKEYIKNMLRQEYLKDEPMPNGSFQISVTKEGKNYADNKKPG